METAASLLTVRILKAVITAPVSLDIPVMDLPVQVCFCSCEVLRALEKESLVNVFLKS